MVARSEIIEVSVSTLFLLILIIEFISNFFLFFFLIVFVVGVIVGTSKVTTDMGIIAVILVATSRGT